jgi:hypothetical protein
MKNNAPLSKKLQLSFLGAVIEFMARIGVAESDIRAAFEKGMAKAKDVAKASRRTDADARYRADGDVSAYLLRLWSRDERLVDNVTYSPRPLPLLKGKRNLRSLIASLDPAVDPMEVLTDMKTAGLIRHVSGGRYLPTDAGAIFSSLHPWAIEHTVTSVVRLVSTVCRNASCPSTEPRLLERYSYVPDLDPAHRRAFADFSRMQGLAYLEAVDDWLEQRRIRNKGPVSRNNKKKGVAAGVHLISYLSDPIGALRNPKKPSGS